MNLSERYLNEVARRLPKTKRDDIRDELRSALDDALESRAGGAEPTDDDAIAVLKDFGPPAAVAASYGGDRYLIGPKLYPQFRTTLRIVLTVLAGLFVLSLAISVLRDLASFANRLGVVLPELVGTAVTSVGIVVIVFAVLERLEVGESIRAKDWDPRKLPVVRDTDLAARFDSIAGVVFPAVILILFNQYRDAIGITVNPGCVLLLNDVFLDNLPWLNASLLLPMALSVFLFWSGRWHWTSRLLKIAFDLFGLFVLHRVCQGVIAARGDLAAAGLPERLVEVLVGAVAVAPALAALLVLAGAAKHLYRAYRSFD